MIISILLIIIIIIIVIQTLIKFIWMDSWIKCGNFVFSNV